MLWTDRWTDRRVRSISLILLIPHREAEGGYAPDSMYIQETSHSDNDPSMALDIPSSQDTSTHKTWDADLK